MATAKKRQDGEVREKFIDDVSRQQESKITSQSSESFSPNQKNKKRFSHESTNEGEYSETSETSSNNFSQDFHDNHHGGVSMATSNSQSNAFNSMTNLFSGDHRQQGVQNNPLGVAMLEGGECIHQGFYQQKNISQI